MHAGPAYSRRLASSPKRIYFCPAHSMYIYLHSFEPNTLINTIIWVFQWSTLKINLNFLQIVPINLIIFYPLTKKIMHFFSLFNIKVQEIAISNIYFFFSFFLPCHSLKHQKLAVNFFWKPHKVPDIQYFPQLQLTWITFFCLPPQLVIDVVIGSSYQSRTCSLLAYDCLSSSYFY